MHTCKKHSMLVEEAQEESSPDMVKILLSLGESLRAIVDTQITIIELLKEIGGVKDEETTTK